MQSIRQLIQAANPVPADRSTGLSSRAESELTALLGTIPDDVRQPPQRPRPAARRARLVFAAAAAVVAVGVGSAFWMLRDDVAGPPSTGAEPFYRDAQSLEKRADIIVRATIRATRPEEREGIAETVASAVVTKSAKGKAAAGEGIEFAYTRPGSAPEAPTGLKVGGEYVLLLESRANAPAFVVSSVQGYYTVTAGKATPNENNPVALSAGVREKLGLR